VLNLCQKHHDTTRRHAQLSVSYVMGCYEVSHDKKHDDMYDDTRVYHKSDTTKHAPTDFRKKVTCQHVYMIL
jgi:hypothetical protein